MICSLFVLPVKQVYAEDMSINVNIPVRHEFILQDTSYHNVNMAGVYVLETKSQDIPMPQGGTEQTYEFELDGKEAMTNLTMRYTHGGVYEYKLYQKMEEKENYIYDASTYDITVYVKNTESGKLIPQIVVKNEQGEKSIEVVFRNNYKPKQKDNSKSPKTGDTTNLGLLILMIVVSGGMLFYLDRKKRKN